MDARQQATVHAAIANVIQTANRLADCKAREMEFEGRRSQVKSEAIARIMSLPDPQKDGKFYSATAAADIVMNDAAFSIHAADQRAATADTIRAAGEYEAAKLAARFGIAAAEVEGYEALRLALSDAHTMVLK